MKASKKKTEAAEWNFTRKSQNDGIKNNEKEENEEVETSFAFWLAIMGK